MFDNEHFQFFNQKENHMYQQITIVGYLGKDPEMRYTGAGTPVTSFNVGVNRVWNNDQGVKQEESTWFRVTAWNKQAETCAQYLKKGSQVLVTGTVKANAYTNRDGEVVASLEVKADIVRFLGGSGNGSGRNSDGATSYGQQADQNARVAEEDIPF